MRLPATHAGINLCNFHGCGASAHSCAAGAAHVLMHVEVFQQALRHVQAYRRVLEHVKTATGLPESRLLDVRGNHDTFNVPSRCSHMSLLPAVRHTEAELCHLHSLQCPCAVATHTAWMPML